MMPVPHTLQDYDPDVAKSMDVDISLMDDRVVVDEARVDDGRAIVVEYTDDVLQVRVYSADKQNPITLRLYEAGGIDVERTDFDKEGGDA
jgi:hypothetical protein